MAKVIFKQLFPVFATTTSRRKLAEAVRNRLPSLGEVGAEGKLVVRWGGSMKQIWMAGLALGFFVSVASAQDQPALKTQKDKLSYAIGLEMGKGVKDQGFDVDAEMLARGIKDAIAGGKPLLTDEEFSAIMADVQETMKQKRMQAMEEEAENNKKQGEAFLAENTKKEGVVTLPSGLQYKIITTGQGKKPTENDTVLCNYKGTFIDGTEFDSSAQAGKPVAFDLKGILPGFKEALMLMAVGSKWQLFIPSDLGYGDHGAGNVIGPNATLIFEVELVSIQ
jgi:FKBP-type peptidyl-prolyl cis-trans isomerase